MRRRPAGEEGYAIVAAIVVLFVVLLVVGAALALGVRGLGTSTRQRNEAMALHAADAGAQVALWRMNKLLTGSDTASTLLGVAQGTLQGLECINVSVTNTLVLQPASGPGWCPATTGEDSGDSATFSYQTSTGVNLGSGGLTLERRVVSTGTAGGVSRRVLAVFQLTLDSTAYRNPLALFKQVRWVECPPTATTSDPSSGCADSESP